MCIFLYVYCIPIKTIKNIWVSDSDTCTSLHIIIRKNKVWKGTGDWKRQGREGVCCCFQQAVSLMPGWGDAGRQEAFRQRKCWAQRPTDRSATVDSAKSRVNKEGGSGKWGQSVCGVAGCKDWGVMLIGENQGAPGGLWAAVLKRV